MSSFLDMETIRRVIADYAWQRGRRYDFSRPVVEVNEALALHIADLHDAAIHAPEDPEVKRTYQAFKIETVQQWNALKAAGVIMEPWTKDGQPYANSKEMTEDVANLHLFFYTGGDMLPNHPLAETVPGEGGLTYNAIFRAIHDIVAHAPRGYQFGPKGEENAWREHTQLYSPEALPALAAETRFQNCWINFGKHLRNVEGRVPRKGEDGFVPASERPYAVQKVFAAPIEFAVPDYCIIGG
jgi:hypothetical protein